MPYCLPCGIRKGGEKIEYCRLNIEYLGDSFDFKKNGVKRHPHIFNVQFPDKTRCTLRCNRLLRNSIHGQNSSESVSAFERNVTLNAKPTLKLTKKEIVHNEEISNS